LAANYFDNNLITLKILNLNLAAWSLELAGSLELELGKKFSKFDFSSGAAKFFSGWGPHLFLLLGYCVPVLR